MISHEQNPDYLAWASKVLDVEYRPDPNTTVWMTRLNEDGSVAAVVIFTDFRTHNCEMSVASDGKSMWATREFLGRCYRYAFNQMKMRRVTAIVEDGNKKSLAMCRKLGHVEEGRLCCWFGQKDGIVMRMLREECKWITK